MCFPIYKHKENWLRIRTGNKISTPRTVQSWRAVKVSSSHLLCKQKHLYSIAQRNARIIWEFMRHFTKSHYFIRNGLWHIYTHTRQENISQGYVCVCVGFTLPYIFYMMFFCFYMLNILSEWRCQKKKSYRFSLSYKLFSFCIVFCRWSTWPKCKIFVVLFFSSYVFGHE